MKRNERVRYSRALIYFVATLAAFLAAADVMILSNQRRMIMDEARQTAESELGLIGTVAREALLKRDYLTIERFITRWGKERGAVVMVQAAAPNGFILASYMRDEPAGSPFHASAVVEYGAGKRVVLEVVKDFGPVEKGLNELAAGLIMWSFLIAAVMGALLWLTIKELAIKPLEAEVARRRKAEGELVARGDMLDEMVRERTSELVRANDLLRAEISERERIEEMIIASERELSAILNNMQDTYYRAGTDGVVTRVSPSVKYLLDYTPDELVGMRLADLYVNPDERQELLRRLEAGGGRTTNFEVQLRRKDGKAMWVAANVQYLRDDSGNVIGVEGIARDVTELKRAEEAIRLVVEGAITRTGEEFFRSLVGNLATATGVKLAFVAEMAPSGGCKARTIAMWSGGGIVDNIEYELAGTPCEEVYKGLTSFYPDNVQELFPDDRWLVTVNARSYLGIPFFDSDSRVIGHLGVFDDKPITERRYLESIVKLFAARAGAELKRTRAEKKLNQFKSTLDMTLDCVFMFDPVTLRFFYVNQGALRQVGYSFEEMLEMTPLDIKPEFDEEGFRRWIAPLLEGGIPSRTFETTHKRKNGALVPVEIFLQYVTLPGEGGRFVAIVRDITERKRTEEGLRHTQKLESLGIMAGGIAHDFNNLLVGILGSANMALEDLPSSSPARESVEDVIVAARQAADLARQMLAYSGKGKVVVERFDLAATVEEMAHLLEISVAKNVSIVYGIEHGLPAMEGDPSQIRQVVMNLVINAAEAIGGGEGEVKVSLGAVDAGADYLGVFGSGHTLREGRYILLEVADNGCGMDEETMERIFDPFFTTKFTGRGLGLSAVSGIIRGHNGAMRVYSDPGRGTVFKILFPAASGRVRPEKKRPASGAVSGNGGTVLIVDDEETIRNVAKKMLNRAGFSVITAADGAEGVEVFSRGPDKIDLVLLDMTMPRMDGFTAFREMRRARPDVRVILSSGYTEQDAAGRFAGKGVAGFIQKPYTSDVLLRKIGEAIWKKD